MTFIKTNENALGQEAQKNYLPMQPGDVGFEPKTALATGIARWAERYQAYTRI